MRNAAKTVAGLKDVTVGFANHRAEVTYDAAKTTPEAIAKVIAARTRFNALQSGRANLLCMRRFLDDAVN